MTPQVVLAAISTRHRFGISYWDAAILEAARSLGCDTVLSGGSERWPGLRRSAGAEPLSYQLRYRLSRQPQREERRMSAFLCVRDINVPAHAQRASSADGRPGGASQQANASTCEWNLQVESRRIVGACSCLSGMPVVRLRDFPCPERGDWPLVSRQLRLQWRSVMLTVHYP